MKKNKAVILFLLRFFISYIVLSGGYQWFLNSTQQTGIVYKSDPITKKVALQTVSTANFFGYNFSTKQHPEELSFKLFTENRYVARVVEGCNAISVIILFWAFIIAFTGTLNKTLIFGILGSLAIYSINITRIIFLTVAVDKYPKQTHFSHHIVFPAIIYGFTFLLWVVWVKHYALKKT